jgi:hypothetical protein
MINFKEIPFFFQVLRKEFGTTVRNCWRVRNYTSELQFGTLKFFDWLIAAW